MFANMLGPTAIDIAGVSALGQALVYREDEDARGSDKWREEVAQRLEGDLITLDSLTHGFVPAAPSRRSADRSLARIGLGRVAMAVLAVVLGIAITTVLGVRGARVATPNACLHDKTVCKVV
jgi:hypothetical protein